MMPTFHDETLLDRYGREHLSELERYAAMSPLQIEALDIARHNAEAQRDELLQELRYIANAPTQEWDDPMEFEAWAKNRARHAIAKAEAA